MLLPLIRRLLPLFVAALAALVLTTTGTDAIAANDDFPGQRIETLPVEIATDSIGATRESGEVQSGCHGSLRHTLWWNFTPQEDATIIVRFEAADWSPLFSVFTQPFPGAPLTEVACGGFLAFPGEPEQTVATTALEVDAGRSYYIQLGGLGLIARDPASGLVALSIYGPTPPPNDDFANAVNVAGLPFEDEIDLTGATSEPFEPQSPCVSAPEFGVEFANTAWYSYTPDQDSSVAVEVYSGIAYGAAVAWTGQPGNFVEAGCGYPFIMDVQAGTTYYFQVGLQVYTDFPGVVPGLVTFEIEPFVRPTCPGDVSEFTDPSGDIVTEGPFGLDPSSAPSSGDIIGLRTAFDSDSACLIYEFAGPALATSEDEFTVILTFLDTDQDPGTGDPPFGEGSQGPCPWSDFGTDAGILITNTLEETTFPVRRTDPDTGEQEEGLAFLTIEGNTITVAMQTRFVTEDGAFSVLGFTLPEWGFDCFPNSGAINVNYAFNPQFADLNCDGRLDGADAIPVIAMQADVTQHIPAACAALGAPLPGDYTATGDLTAGDLDCSGDIDMTDALYLLHWLIDASEPAADCPAPTDAPAVATAPVALASAESGYRDAFASVVRRSELVRPDLRMMLEEIPHFAP